MALLNRMIGMLTTNDAVKAKAFYSSALGFRLKSEDDFGLFFDAHGTQLRVAKARDFVPTERSALGWEVDDIHASIAELSAKGVVFVQFNLAFMKQDAQGVWTTPSGDQVAWFKDPDGNVLSISRHV